MEYTYKNTNKLDKITRSSFSYQFNYNAYGAISNIAAGGHNLIEAGVRLLYHCGAAAPVMEGSTVKGIYIESKSGREAVLAKVVIDCTGDGDIAARAGPIFGWATIKTACASRARCYLQLGTPMCPI